MNAVSFSKSDGIIECAIVDLVGVDLIGFMFFLTFFRIVVLLIVMKMSYFHYFHDFHDFYCFYTISLQIHCFQQKKCTIKCIIPDIVGVGLIRIWIGSLVFVESAILLCISIINQC